MSHSEPEPSPSMDAHPGSGAAGKDDAPSATERPGFRGKTTLYVVGIAGAAALLLTLVAELLFVGAGGLEPDSTDSGLNSDSATDEAESTPIDESEPQEKAYLVADDMCDDVADVYEAVTGLDAVHNDDSHLGDDDRAGVTCRIRDHEDVADADAVFELSAVHTPNRQEASDSFDSLAQRHSPESGYLEIGDVSGPWTHGVVFAKEDESEVALVARDANLTYVLSRQLADDVELGDVLETLKAFAEQIPDAALRE